MRACVAVLAAVMAGTAQAASVAGGSNEVVVTAARDLRETKDVAASVTVLTAEQIARSGTATVVDALREATGLQVRSITGNPADAEVTMRGFGENGFGRVLVLVDGVRANRPDMGSINWLQFPVNDIERVEIVRGGGSALYGDNAVAGVINIITRRDVTGPFAQASVDYGSYDSLGLRGAAGTGTERYAVDANASYDQSGGYRDRSAYDAYGVGGNVRGDVGDRHQASAGASWREVNGEMPGALTREQMDANPEQSVNPADEVESQYLDTHARWRSAFSDAHEADVTLSFRRSDVKTDWPSLFSFADTTVDSIGVLPKYVWRADCLGHANTLTLGLDVYMEELDAKRFSDAARADQTIDATVSKDTLGAYARDEFALTPSLLLGAGGRVEQATYDATASAKGASLFDTDTRHDETAVEASLVKSFDNQSKIFTRAGTVYRYPFLDEQVSYYGYGTDQFYADLNPEEGWFADLGGEARAGHGVVLAATLFVMNLRDEIAYNSATYRNENLDDTRHQGVETEARYRPVTWCKLGLNYTYTDATFTDGPNDGKDIPLVARHKSGGSVELQVAKGVSAESVVTHVSASPFGGDYANAKEDLDGYTLVDFYVRYQPAWLKGVRTYAGVQNAFDEGYAGYGFYSAWSDQLYYYPSAGRAFKVGLAYVF
jgi:iron complex outermembrane recepter protein